MTIVRLIVLLASFGVMTTSSLSLFEEESSSGWVCCDTDSDCGNAGGKCCDYTLTGGVPCAREAVGYCRDACTIMGEE